MSPQSNHKTKISHGQRVNMKVFNKTWCYPPHQFDDFAGPTISQYNHLPGQKKESVCMCLCVFAFITMQFFAYLSEPFLS